MRISVIIVSYNVRDMLMRCVASARDAHEVIVVDNKSPDDSVSQVRRRFPWAKVVALSNNRGFSAAVNEGARHATGDALLLLNPDAELPVGALERMATTLSQHPDTWAVGFRQVDEHGRFQLAVGPAPTLPGELVRMVLQRRLDAGNRWVPQVLDHLLRDAQAVPWVAGAAMLVHRWAFDRVRGFDERYFLYFEDIDFCLRLRGAGGRVMYDPHITVMHRGGESAATASALAQRAYRESQLRFWEAHRGPWMRRIVHGFLWARGVAP